MWKQYESTMVKKSTGSRARHSDHQIPTPLPTPPTGCRACSTSLLSVNFNFFIYERGAGMISISYRSQLTTNASSLGKLNEIACTGTGRVLGSVSVCCATLALNVFLPASKFSLHTYFNLTAIKLSLTFPASPQGCFHSCGLVDCPVWLEASWRQKYYQVLYFMTFHKHLLKTCWLKSLNKVAVIVLSVYTRCLLNHNVNT